MLQADEPDTFVLATNRTETVRDFVAMACQGGRLSSSSSRGNGEDEIGVDARQRQDAGPRQSRSSTDRPKSSC